MIALMERVHRWEWVPLLVIALWVVYLLAEAFVPVVWMDGTLVSKSPDSVIVAMKGWKFRGCRFHGVQAYSVDEGGFRHSADARRVDRPEKNVTHPVGKYDIGRWDVRPLTGGVSVLVYAHHSCDGDDLRMAKIADVKLP